jgi:ribosome hibernation promoting factor
MQIIIKARQTEVTPRLRQFIEQKVQRLSRLVDADARVEVTVTEEQTRSARDRISVQLALTHTAHPARSEVSAVNAKMALELVLDKIHTQLGRQKGRETTTRRHRTPAVKVLSLSRSGMVVPILAEDAGSVASTYDEAASGEVAASIAAERNAEIWSRVVEIRRVPGKPMDDQEVIAHMQTFGLAFFPFINAATNSVNVMYRMDKGGYGLLVPELD